MYLIQNLEVVTLVVVFCQLFMGGFATETSKKITTGLEACNDIDSIDWSIKSWVTVQKSIALVNDQKFEYVAGRTRACQTKWMIGLRYQAPNIGVHFKLLSTYETGTHTPLKIKFHLRQADGQAYKPKSFERSLSPDQEVFQPDYLGFNHTSSDWRTWLHEDETLIIKIELVALKTIRKIGPNSPPNVTYDADHFNQQFLTKMQKDFSGLLTNSSSPDIKIVCKDDKEFFAHKVILSARCPICVSRPSLSTELSKAKIDEILMKNVAGKTMGILLHYFYTGEVLPEWQDEDTIEDFIRTSKKFELIEVLEMVDKSIGNQDHSKYSIQLLDVIKSAGLQTAEAIISRNLVKRSTVANNTDDLVALCRCK